MRNIQNGLIALFFIPLTAFCFEASQHIPTNELPYEVNRVYPYLFITKEKLKEAHTLIDLNKRYPSSWIRTYLSVEILTSHNGKIQKARGKNAMLTEEQKKLMEMADAGTDIFVKVQYMPENTLKHNEPKEIKFKFLVEPENAATYFGGQQRLKQYLKEKAIDKIPNGSFKGFDLTTVKFTVNEEGKIIDAHVFWPSKNEKIDALLLEAIRYMPDWKPAIYADGTKVKQEFALTVGNHKNCIINLLNLHQD